MHERERVAADRQARTTLRDEHKRQAREKNLK
jgi:heme exporter protein D